ncbi:MAG: CysS/YqeB C-terminal domain-containing protein, partial [Thermoproteota archaeon]
SNILRIANDILLKRGQYPKDVLKSSLLYIREKAKTIGDILGIMDKVPSVALKEITLLKAQRLGIDIEAVKKLIEERALARKEKNFAKSDEIRNRLLEMGISVMDTPEGTIWRIER